MYKYIAYFDFQWMNEGVRACVGGIPDGYCYQGIPEFRQLCSVFRPVFDLISLIPDFFADWEMLQRGVGPLYIYTSLLPSYLSIQPSAIHPLPAEQLTRHFHTHIHPADVHSGKMHSDSGRVCIQWIGCVHASNGLSHSNLLPASGLIHPRFKNYELIVVIYIQDYIIYYSILLLLLLL